MGIINILDTQTANMIAAGEVVEKPAAAVKEMIENSIDAGATHIICEIKAGGNSFIRITDDGKGISGDDLPKTILPHATSKIKTAEDLDGVLTLGFRGEALAAISSVSRLEILSKQKSDSIGHKLTSDENGVDVSEEGLPDGTTITVRDLFYNVPARRKFMRKDSSEASAIAAVLTKAALSHPEISFKLISDGVTKFITPGDSDLYSAIYSTLGKDFAKSLTAVAGVHKDVTVGGYVSKHGESRGSRSGQYFFVNGRPIQSTQIMASLEQAFRSYMPPKRFPAAVLMINVPPKSIDVNVHPTKTEIKFADDRKIFEAIYSTVLSTLRCEDKAVEFTQQSVPQAVSFVTEQKNTLEEASSDSVDKVIHTPVYNEKNTGSYALFRDPNVPLDTSFEDRVKYADDKKAADISLPTEKEIREVQQSIAKNTPVVTVHTESPTERVSETVENISYNFTQPQKSFDTTQIEHNIPKEKIDFKVIGEVFGGYIVAQTETELLLIDKHAAHERILYEELVSKRTSAQSQYLISPHVVRPGVEATDLLLENKELLTSYGFEIDSFGNDSIALRAIPAVLSGINGVEALLDDFADSLSHGDRLSFEKRCDRALYTLACKAAIKLGPPSKNEELSVLVEKLLSDPKLKLCPHGRPIVKTISKREIEKFFDR